MISPPFDLYLASKSPRRAALLGQLGVSFSVLPVDIDERRNGQETPADYVERLGLEKAKMARAITRDDIPILGSDTTVVADDRILSKPADLDDALRILRRLSGRWHEVYTAVALLTHSPSSLVVKTRVKFKPLSTGDIEAYWHTGEPQDKAGAYGIQGFGASFVERIEGSYSAVVGLPLFETANLLTAAGVPWALNKRATESPT